MVVRKSDPSRKKTSNEDNSIASVSNNSLNNLSLDVFEETDYYGKGRASFSRVYEVFDGVLHVIINDEEIILNKGDSIFIGKGTIYEMKGTFKVIAVNKVATGI